MRVLGRLVTGVAISLGCVDAAAAGCETQAKALEAAKGGEVATAFSALAACDSAAAGEAFAGAVRQTGDVDALVALAEAGIVSEHVAEVQGLLELVPEHSAKEQTAKGLGERCAASDKVDGFFAGLMGSVKPRQFVGWAGGLRACATETTNAAIEAAVTSPPPRAFDDVYAVVVDVYGHWRGAEALPALEKAATTSLTNNGPFAVLLDSMADAVTPEGIGAKPTEADSAALIASYGRLADQATGESIERLANALVTMGAVDAAGKLLPKQYPDRVQSGGGFLYGVASVETCDSGTVVHWAVVEDPAARWSIATAVDAPARAFKRKLKCDAPFAISITPEPQQKANDVAIWAGSVAERAGDKAKLKGEKKVVLN